MSENAEAAPRRAGGWLGLLADIAVALLVVTVAKTAIAEPFYVPSGSMEPTLQIGDAVVAAKFAYGYSAASLPTALPLGPTRRILGALPARGDVVVFRWPGDRSQIWVKRVIGLPGDRIAVRDGQVVINGTPVGLRRDGNGRIERDDGSSVTAARFVETLPGGRSHLIFLTAPGSPLENTPPVVVPPHDLFVMGDNRDDSADSRVPRADGGVGLLPVANLVGKVDAVVGSWDFAAADGPPWTWPSELRLSRFFTAVR
ncbi:MAG TPA: signal peptidase I [Hyphomicrobiales bacterium]|nr:signal peptidase I [Hyphomicrobiales bacterium]